MEINIVEAVALFPSLIVAAEHDEEVIIARNGVPVAKIIKYSTPAVAAPGAWKGKTAYTADWDSAETNATIAHLITDDSHAPIA